MEKYGIYIIGACLIFMLSLVVVLCFNTEKKVEGEKTNETRVKASHRRTIQFVVVWLFPPTIIILFILGFDVKILATLFGTYLGYVLTGVGETST